MYMYIYIYKTLIPTFPTKNQPDFPRLGVKGLGFWGSPFGQQPLAQNSFRGWGGGGGSAFELQLLIVAAVTIRGKPKVHSAGFRV